MVPTNFLRTGATMPRSGGLCRLLRIDHAPALGGDRPIDQLAGRRRFKMQTIIAMLIPLRRVLILYNGLRNLGSGRSRRRCADHCGANRCSGYAGGDGQHSSSGNFLGACHESSPGTHPRKQRQGRTSVPNLSTKCCISDAARTMCNFYSIATSQAVIIARSAEEMFAEQGVNRPLVANETTPI